MWRRIRSAATSKQTPGSLAGRGLGLSSSQAGDPHHPDRPTPPQPTCSRRTEARGTSRPISRRQPTRRSRDTPRRCISASTCREWWDGGESEG